MMSALASLLAPRDDCGWGVGCPPSFQGASSTMQLVFSPLGRACMFPVLPGYAAKEGPTS